MPVTSYPSAPSVGYAGQLTYLGPKFVVEVRNEETEAIPFGLGMIKGTADDQVLLPSSSSDKVIGVGVHVQDRDPVTLIAATNSAAGVPQDDSMDMLDKGVILVQVEEAVVKDDNAFCRFAYGTVLGNDQRGAWRKTADAIVAWAISTAYTVGQRVENDTGKLYECTVAGTSAGSGGPTGTGSAIVDNTVTWKYVAAQGTGATAFTVKGARYLESGAASAIVPLQFDAALALSA